MSALGFVGGLAGAIAFGIYGLIALVFFTAATLEQAERGATSRTALVLAVMSAIFWPLSLLVASIAAAHFSSKTRERRQRNASRPEALPGGRGNQGRARAQRLAAAGDEASGNSTRTDAGSGPPVPVLTGGGKRRGSAAPDSQQGTPKAGPAPEPPPAPAAAEDKSAPEPPSGAVDAKRQENTQHTVQPGSGLLFGACGNPLSAPSAIHGLIVRSLAPLQMQPQAQAPSVRPWPGNRTRLMLFPRQYQGDGRHSDPKPSGSKPGVRHSRSRGKGSSR